MPIIGNRSGNATAAIGQSGNRAWLTGWLAEWLLPCCLGRACWLAGWVVDAGWLKACQPAERLATLVRADWLAGWELAPAG